MGKYTFTLATSGKKQKPASLEIIAAQQTEENRKTTKTTDFKYLKLDIVKIGLVSAAIIEILMRVISRFYYKQNIFIFFILLCEENQYRSTPDFDKIA